MFALNVIIGPMGAERPQATAGRVEQSGTEVQADEIARNDSDTGNVGVFANIDSDLPDESARWLTFEATAYIAMCQSGCTGVTATGIDVRQSHTYEGMRIIATDPAVVPLWSIVELRYADGSTERAVAADTGGAIGGNRIDLLVADEATAWAFGRQDVGLRIIEEAN
jgi:3D (Asp-Asp-Asp) domain-containing protein